MATAHVLALAAGATVPTESASVPTESAQPVRAVPANAEVAWAKQAAGKAALMTQAAEAGVKAARGAKRPAETAPETAPEAAPAAAPEGKKQKTTEKPAEKKKQKSLTVAQHLEMVRATYAADVQVRKQLKDNLTGHTDWVAFLDTLNKHKQNMTEIEKSAKALADKQKIAQATLALLSGDQ